MFQLVGHNRRTPLHVRDTSVRLHKNPCRLSPVSWSFTSSEGVYGRRNLPSVRNPVQIESIHWVLPIFVLQACSHSTEIVQCGPPCQSSRCIRHDYWLRTNWRDPFCGLSRDHEPKPFAWHGREGPNAWWPWRQGWFPTCATTPPIAPTTRRLSRSWKTNSLASSGWSIESDGQGIAR